MLSGEAGILITLKLSKVVSWRLRNESEWEGAEKTRSR